MINLTSDQCTYRNAVAIEVQLLTAESKSASRLWPTDRKNSPI